MKVTNVAAAVAGGLVLGAAVFMPIGANALNQELQQVTQTQSSQKVAESNAGQALESSIDSDHVRENSKPADLTPTPGANPGESATQTPAPSPTFSSEDEGSGDDDSQYGSDGSDEGKTDE